MNQQRTKQKSYKIKATSNRRAKLSHNKNRFKIIHWLGSSYFSNTIQLITLFLSIIMAFYIYNLQRYDQIATNIKNENDQQIRDLLYNNNFYMIQQKINRIETSTGCSLNLVKLSFLANDIESVNLTDEMLARCTISGTPLPSQLLDRVRQASKSQNSDTARAANTVLKKVEDYSNNPNYAIRDFVNRTPNLSALRPEIDHIESRGIPKALIF